MGTSRKLPRVRLSSSRQPRLARPSRRTALALAGLVLVMLAALIASAFASKGVLDYFGNSSTASSTAGGEFSTASLGVGGVAVNDSGTGGVSAGDVYVVDRGNNRIEEFSAMGAFVRAFGLNVGGTGVDVCSASCAAGTASAAAAGMSAPQGVTVDQATGNLFVTDQNNRRIDVFSATGTFEGAFGWKVDSAGPEEKLQFCTATTGCGAGTAGAGAGELNSTVGYPAVAPAGAPNAGDLLVADSLNGRIDEFSLTENATSKVVEGASFVRAIGWGVISNSDLELQECTTASGCVRGLGGSGVGEFGLRALSRVAEDTTGAIYTVESSSNWRVQKFTPQTGPPALSASVFAASTLSGTGSKDTPTDVAVDPASNDVYVVKVYAAGEGTPAASSEERRVLQLSPSGDLLETGMAGAEINSVNGIADSTTGQVYVTSTTGAQRVYILDTVPQSVPTVMPTTEIGPHEATLNGTVNPDGGPLETSWQFEYSFDETTWVKAPAGMVGLGSFSETPVSATITGLEPNQTYQVRLVASKPFGSATVSSAPQSFTTVAIPPEPSTLDAWWNEPAGMELTGQVNPNNLPTTYRFQYGACGEAGESSCQAGEYESTVPAAGEASAGQGSKPIIVHQQITGLQAGRAYHFRLVATSAAGTVYGAEQTVASREQSRVYEMVTPLEKGGRDFSLSRALPTAPGGEAVGISSLGGFTNPEQTTNFDGAAGNIYAARRNSSGWQLSGTFAPANLWPGVTSIPSAVGYTPDLSEVVACGPIEPNLSTGGTRGSDFGCALREANGKWVAGSIYRASESETAVAQHNNFLAVSEHAAHVFFKPYKHLLPADNAPNGGGGDSSIYEVEGLGTGSETLRLVNVNNGGEAITGTTTTEYGLGAGAGTSPSEQYEVYHAISESGETIFFTAAPAGGAITLYARLHHSETVTIASEAEFQGASANGEKVFFTTTQKLVAGDTDSSGDVYEYDFAKPAGERVVQVSGGGLGDPKPGSGANVQGVISTSRDGSHVYFVAQGVLTSLPNARGQSATAGADNLYAYDTKSEQTQFVAMLCSGSGKSGGYTPPSPDPCPSAGSASDAEMWAAHIRSNAQGAPAAQETPDGNYLVFTTYGKLVMSGPEADTDEAQDVYRYDFQTGELLRASIGEPSFPASANGDTPEKNATIAKRPDSTSAVVENTVYAEGDADTADRAISENGQEIVFTTPEQLQADDVNGGPGNSSCPVETAPTVYSMAGCDIYVWRYRKAASSENQGAVGMVSSGESTAGVDPQTIFKSAPASNQVGRPSMSASGSDVFFATSTPLAPGDTDTLTDVYDARIGGGFPGPAPQTSCSGEGCQGASSTPPIFEAPSTISFTGGLNLTPPPEKPVVKPKPKPKPKLSCKAKFKHVKNNKKRHRKIMRCKRQRHKGKASRLHHKHHTHQHHRGRGK